MISRGLTSDKMHEKKDNNRRNIILAAAIIVFAAVLVVLGTGCKLEDGVYVGQAVDGEQAAAKLKGFIGSVEDGKQIPLLVLNGTTAKKTTIDSLNGYLLNVPHAGGINNYFLDASGYLHKANC